MRAVVSGAELEGFSLTIVVVVSDTGGAVVELTGSSFLLLSDDAAGWSDVVESSAF